ncbi:MAG: hypothetical protein ACJAYB_000063 [Psychromonas sp.]|jgi:hypothetical protein
MTTIVYDKEAGQIAFDGQLTNGDVIVRLDSQKMVRAGDDLLFLCGNLDAEQEFIHAFTTGGLCESTQVGAFFVRNHEAFACGVGEDFKLFTYSLESSWAIGTGQHFALAALDFGQSARDAVQYAVERDIYTGGKVSVYDIEKGELVNDDFEVDQNKDFDTSTPFGGGSHFVSYPPPQPDPNFVECYTPKKRGKIDSKIESKDNSAD